MSEEIERDFLTVYTDQLNEVIRAIEVELASHRFGVTAAVDMGDGFSLWWQRTGRGEDWGFVVKNPTKDGFAPCPLLQASRQVRMSSVQFFNPLLDKIREAKELKETEVGKALASATIFLDDIRRKSRP